MSLKTFTNISFSNKSQVIDHLSSVIKNAPKVICFYGDFGAGKTALAHELVNQLADTNHEVTSPTFNIVQTYETPIGEVWHMDLYRLNSLEEVYNLGFEEALDSKILIIEWPQIVEHILPPDAIKVYINFSDNDNMRNYNLECA
jgi:tRNA threonylcarbamoyladenosine biosynthesis protein TsaE